jgi:hypothetical protein
MPVPNAIHIDAPTEPKKAEDFTRRDVERDAVNRSGLTECGGVIHSVEEAMGSTNSFDCSRQPPQTPMICPWT